MVTRCRWASRSRFVAFVFMVRILAKVEILVCLYLHILPPAAPYTSHQDDCLRPPQPQNVVTGTPWQDLTGDPGNLLLGCHGLCPWHHSRTGIQRSLIRVRHCIVSGHPDRAVPAFIFGRAVPA
jgi:hypothetical protein